MGDTVYIGSCNGMFRALELKTGRLRWETKLSPDAEQYFFHGDPAALGDVIVTGADRSAGASIHGVDRLSGKELWKQPVGRGVLGPIAGANGRAYASTVAGQLLAFDAPSGAVRWSIELKVPGWEGPAVTRVGVFAGTVDGWVYRLSAETRREEWRVNVGTAVSTTPMVSANDLYVGTADGAFHRIDAAHGTVTNTHKIDEMLRPKSVPAKASDSVVVLLGDASADNRAVVSLDPALTTIRWRVSAEPRWTTSRVFVWGDVIVVGTPSGDVKAYCSKTGALTWSRRIKGPVRSIGGAEDILLVGTPNGDLYAMRTPRSCDAKSSE